MMTPNLTKMKHIDVRSDTVTHPTTSMYDYMMKARLGDDVYNEDDTVIELERLAAEITGMEAALFVPTGYLNYFNK